MAYNKKIEIQVKMSKFINNSQKKPFCKVCFDARKPESEYTSHYVRSQPDSNGKTIVTCPILAATECRYCFKFGHTIKFCNVLEEKKKKDNKEKSVAIRAQKAAERAATEVHFVEDRTPLTYKGKFAGLEDIEEVVEKFEADEPNDSSFPSLHKKTVQFADEKPANNWAAIASKPAPKPAAKPAAKPAPKALATKSWADESDSDDEQNDADQYLNKQNEYGENVYAQVSQYYSEDKAGRITAIILESYELDEVFRLIANPASLREIADEANAVAFPNIIPVGRAIAEDDNW
jgi:hypothetical protein